MGQRTLELSRWDRIAAWYYTGPLGRIVAFGLDLGSFFVAGLAHGLSRISYRLRSR
jgi:hypothetical protein